MSLKIYGHSDDLVEVEGDIDEEFYATEGCSTGALIALSDGNVLGLQYTDDGIWRFTQEFQGSGAVTIVRAPDIDPDDQNYSDIATIEGTIDWVLVDGEMRKRGAK
jgi:hypothetical protein